MIKVERFDADAITSEDKLLAVRIPQGYRKVAFNLVDEIEAALFVEVNNGFRVGTRMVNVAALFEAFTKTCVVVNLAVEDQPDAFRATMHRLISRRRKIDDRETAKTKTAASLVDE